MESKQKHRPPNLISLPCPHEETKISKPPLEQRLQGFFSPFWEHDPTLRIGNFSPWLEKLTWYKESNNQKQKIKYLVHL